MRTGFVIPSLQDPSGWRTAAVGMISALGELGCIEPVLIVSRQDAPAAEQLFPDLEVFALPGIQDMCFSRARTWPTLLATRLEVRRGPFPRLDLVHSLDAYPTGLVGHWLAQCREIPHVLTALGTYSVLWAGKPLDRQAYSRVLSRASLICPISEGTAELMRKYFPRPLARTPTRVVHLGTDLTATIPKAVAWDRQPAPEPFLLSVAAIKPRKGLDLTISAFSAVEKEFPSARLIIVGDPGNGSYKRHLLEHARLLGAKNVTFLDNVEQDKLEGLYRAASLFVLTPRMEGLSFEGFGLVYLEAGAFGLPIVATMSGGVPDAVRSGITGFLEPEDPECISAAMLRILRDPELARTLGRANRKHSETLTWRRFAVNQVAAYRTFLPSILEKNSPRAF